MCAPAMAYAAPAGYNSEGNSVDGSNSVEMKIKVEASTINIDVPAVTPDPDDPKWNEATAKAAATTWIFKEDGTNTIPNLPVKNNSSVVSIDLKSLDFAKAGDWTIDPAGTTYDNSQIGIKHFAIANEDAVTDEENGVTNLPISKTVEPLETVTIGQEDIQINRPGFNEGAEAVHAFDLTINYGITA